MKTRALITGLGILGAWALAAEPARADLMGIIPQNPREAGLDDISNVLLFIVQWALAFSAGLAAVFVVVSGYQYVLAAGNPEKLEKAKMGLTWSLTGFVLTIAAYSIVLLLQEVLGAEQTVKTLGPQLDGPDEAGNVIAGLTQLVLVFGGITAVLFMLLGGYRYITSQGNPDLADKAKKTLLYSVIGLIVVMASYAIFSVATDALKVKPSFL